MSRMPRINIENALYYVVSSGDHNEDIFKEGSDYIVYLDLLKRHKKEQGFKLFGYCLAPNQINLLIELSGESTISQIMHGLNSTYTKYFNAKYKKSGHLFQERFKMVLVEKEPNLLDMTAYINLRPKLLNITKDPAGYSYSSYPSYLYITKEQKNKRTEERRNGGTPEVDIENEIREVAGYIRDKNYENFISEFTNDDIEKIGRDLNKKSIMGSDIFLKEVQSRIDGEKRKAASAAVSSPAAKRFIAAGTALVIILSLATFYLYARSVKTKQDLSRKFAEEMEKKSTELDVRLKQEKANIRKDLSGKYRADMVSLEAMSKRLEVEKTKTRELEGMLKNKSK